MITTTPRPGDDRIVLRGGTVVDPAGMRSADVAVDRGLITAVGEVPAEVDDTIIDCSGRLVLPGFVDAHSHADGLLTDEGVQQALLRQGVTTVITGQDGVSYAPGDGAYATDYFAAINGGHPLYTGGGVAALLSAADGTSRLNLAYLVPAGTVRWEICGRSDAPASPDQREAMAGLVEQGMRDGALGLSTGLDYVPGIFATTEEIAELCGPVARAGGVYATHMRGGYEANAAAGIDEVARIATTAGVPVHVSHFHAQADIVLAQLGRLDADGVDATFDAYPYIRGCSLLTMPLLPPELSVRPTADVLTALRDPAERARLRRDWFPQVARNPSLGPDWASMLTLAHVAAPELAWAHGLTLDQVARRTGTDPIDAALDVLAASELQVNTVMAVRYARPVSELARIFAHPAHLAGSDGIFIGAHPHPRARGTFGAYLREYVRHGRTWTWPQAVHHLSTGAAARFGLGRRGTVTAGAVADLVVVDPDTVTDTATYDEPMGECIGIDDVLVAGVPVLAHGDLTHRTPGRGIRRAGTGQ